MRLIQQFSALFALCLPLLILAKASLPLFSGPDGPEAPTALNVEITALKGQLHQLLQEQISCDSSCITEQDYHRFEAQIATINQLASNEKKAFSSVGNLTLNQILLDLRRPGLSTRQLQSNLMGYITKLNEHLRQLQAYQSQQRFEQQQKNLKWLTAALLLELLCVALWLWSGQRGSAYLLAQLQMAKTSLKRLQRFTYIQKNATTDRHDQLESLGREERAITNAFIELASSARQANEEQDLYKQLYGFIGYEIRSITNNIQGNLKLLLQEADEESLTLAKNVSTSADTLIDLANNYNSLLSAGANTSATQINLNQLISSLSITLSHRLLESHCEFDCLVETDVPIEISGNYTRLFWSLLITFSNLAQAQKNQTNLLHIRSQNSAHVENIRLFFDFIQLESNQDSVARLLSTQWSSLPNAPNTNKSAFRLLPEKANAQGRWLSADRAQLFSLSLDCTPLNYFNPDRLFSGKKSLVCGADIIHTSVLVKSLQDLHLMVDVVRTPNELFKKIGSKISFDVIIISDTMKGIKLSSFCKTLKSRLAKQGNTKLVMSVSDPQADPQSYAAVDKIYTHPFTTYELGQKLNDIFSEQDEEQEEKLPILVVEDDKIQQFILTQILTKQEYQSVGVFDGISALEQFEQSSFNIIFMDCVLPGIDGLETTRRIRALEKEQGRPMTTIIGATALTSTDEHRACIDAGMDYVIRKPYNADEIAKVIRKYAALQKIS